MDYIASVFLFFSVAERIVVHFIRFSRYQRNGAIARCSWGSRSTFSRVRPGGSSPETIKVCGGRGGGEKASIPPTPAAHAWVRAEDPAEPRWLTARLAALNHQLCSSFSKSKASLQELKSASNKRAEQTHAFLFMRGRGAYKKHTSLWRVTPGMRNSWMPLGDVSFQPDSTRVL